jgi:hypothetical protein
MRNLRAQILQFPLQMFGPLHLCIQLAIDVVDVLINAGPGMPCAPRAPLLVAIDTPLVDTSDDFLNAPDVMRDASFHRWRHPERLMHTARVVIHEIECHHRGVILQLF